MRCQSKPDGAQAHEGARLEQAGLFDCRRAANGDERAPQSTLKTRMLKIEDGDPLVGKRISSKIRLKGQWLEQAGFRPGGRVSVKFIGPGAIELRSDQASSG